MDAFIEFANTNMLSSRCLKMPKAEVFSAHGYLGQYLSIIPNKKLIALRQIDYRSVKDQNVAEFSRFRNLVMEVGALLTDE